MSSITTSHSSFEGSASSTGLLTSGYDDRSTASMAQAVSSTGGPDTNGLKYATVTQDGTTRKILLCSTIGASDAQPSVGCWGSSTANEGPSHKVSVGMWSVGVFFMVASLAGMT
ncbi:hypothetical protein JCM33374_g2461 [Metschnikowia sp. JCM 33374]|nr:hypothetical protein JCM33374_g2461 [Metschnikowia sp. JCM 33374]